MVDLAEASIDALLDFGSVKSIPIVSTLVALRKPRRTYVKGDVEKLNSLSALRGYLAGEILLKQYEIRPLERCEKCDRVVECDYIRTLHQYPFDVGDILLDCKAFYIVFRELEERCRIPFGDVEKMRQYGEEVDRGGHPFLDPVMVVDGSLAVELAMKALTLRETGTFDCVHKLDKLFYSLPREHLNALSVLIKERAHQNDETLKVNLEMISDCFTEWRYFFQKDSVGYTEFLIEFIHIVCDYAIEKLEDTSWVASEV